MDDGTKAAFAAVVGRPSVGKSTLINCICGQKVAIVSAVPQTTRDAIRGIVNRPQGQLVFIDTPGRYQSEKKINRKLLDISGKAAGEADLILYVLDATRPPGPEEEDIAAFVLPYAARTVIAVNKMDAVSKKGTRGADYDSISGFLDRSLPGIGGERRFPVSAKNNEGIEPLLAMLFDMAPQGDPFYGAEYYTDQEVDFRIAEIIREQAINRLRFELPHALRVAVADTQLSGDEAQGRRKLWVRAFIIVERDSQKGIVVGSGGSMIKAIRLAAQKELGKIFDWKIELDIRVKTG